MKLILQAAALSFLVWLCLGCGANENLTLINPINNGIWYQDSTLRFSIVVKQPQKHLDFLYQVQYSNEYPFENVWLDYALVDPNGKLMANSRDNLGLFDARTGKPLGEGTDRRRYIDAYFLKNIQLPEKGEYSLLVKHYMRPDSISGIQSIGLKIRPNED